METSILLEWKQHLYIRSNRETQNVVTRALQRYLVLVTWSYL